MCRSSPLSVRVPLALALVLALTLGTARLHGAPPVFQALTVDEAMAQAKENERILVVKATAVWCGPCKQMDKTTWIDPRVEAWFKDHGVAVALDVDERPEESTRLRIRAMPTMIAFKDGVEADRAVGYQSADELLEWLGRVERGESSIDALRRLAGDREAEQVDASARFELARALADAGRFEEATDEYLWLWRHGAERDPSFAGVRVSFMTSAMGALASESAEAKARFAELRDGAEARVLSGEASRLEAVEWAALNDDVLGEPERTLGWFDKAKGDPKQARAVRSVGARIRPLLIELGRYADAGEVSNGPREAQHLIASIAMARGFMAENPDAAERADLLDDMADHVRNEVACVAACALAAGKDEEAAQVVRQLLAADDTPAARIAVVEWALRVDKPHAGLAPLLDAAAETGADVAALRRRLDDALDAGGDE